MTKNHNPMGTRGFAFIEYASPEPEKLAELFSKMGFVVIAESSEGHLLFQQGAIYFLLNQSKSGFAKTFASRHGPSVCSMGFLLDDAQKAFEHAKQFGAVVPGETSLKLPAISGIGGTLLYFTDAATGVVFQELGFTFKDQATPATELMILDHLTHNVKQGNMDKWAKFYQDLFNFREIRYFDIKGKKTGLISRALASPCGNIRIPINESTDDQSQIEEFIRELNGEGIQHIALTTKNIYKTIPALKARGLQFLDTPETYYDLLEKRIPNHQEDIESLRKHKILLDGAVFEDGTKDLLLQIFTETVIGPVFFEIIERKGNQGFGEGNFQALFEAIELDQMKRGVL